MATINGPMTLYISITTSSGKGIVYCCSSHNKVQIGSMYHGTTINLKRL